MHTDVCVDMHHRAQEQLSLVTNIVMAYMWLHHRAKEQFPLVVQVDLHAVSLCLCQEVLQCHLIYNITLAAVRPLLTD